VKKVLCPECNNQMAKKKKFWFCEECGKSIAFLHCDSDESIENYFYTETFEEYYSIIATICPVYSLTVVGILDIN
jgi:predicted amidophosphoribosyltransferase